MVPKGLNSLNSQTHDTIIILCIARHQRNARGSPPGLLHFWNKQISHKFFNAAPSATADVVGSSDRPCATGMKETNQKGTVRVSVSALLTRLRCSSSELKNRVARNFSTFRLSSRSFAMKGAAHSVRRAA